MNRYHFDDKTCPLNIPEHKKGHVHWLDNVALMGSSTVVQILAKHIEYWVAEQTLRPLGWQKYNKKVKNGYVIVPDKERLPDIKKMQHSIGLMKPKVWMEYLDSCYKAHGRKKDEAAVVGTDRHKVLELWILDCIKNHSGVPTATAEGVEVFCEWAKKNVKRFHLSEAHVYSEVLWTGGIMDVVWEDMDGRIVGADFKSSKDVFFSQFCQLAGYDVMLTENGGHDEVGNKTFELPSPIQAYCIAPFGQEEFDPVIIDNVEDFRSAFRSIVHLYKLDKSFTKVKVDSIKSVVASTKLLPLSELLGE